MRNSARVVLAALLVVATVPTVDAHASMRIPYTYEADNFQARLGGTTDAHAVKVLGKTASKSTLWGRTPS
jgi:hypothetical protein